MTAKLRKSVREDARCRSERIAYLGPDGQVERDQIVVSLGRGIVFCHVYSYDENLFVAWDAHVNFGEWAESQVASGYIKRLRRYADIRTVVPGFHTITEYDLIDVN